MAKYYVVKNGRKKGIFNTWDETRAQVDGYQGAIHKSFKTLAEAMAWMNDEETKVCVTTPRSNKITQSKQLENKITNVETSSNNNNNTTNSSNNQVIYTDGSCQKTRGGWAYVIVDDNEITVEKSGPMPEYPTTNNRAELMAILLALKDNPTSSITLYSDSMYSIKSLTLWYKSWIKRGWITTSGTLVENRDLIEEILALQKNRNIEYIHVYGHNKNPFNERCDYLAKSAVTSYND